MAFNIAIGPRERKSPFYDCTVEDGVTHFTVYNHMYMPVSYGDPEAEYRRLIQGVTMWDVGAERQVEITGPDAERLVRYLTPRDLKDLPIGKGHYVPICDHDGNLINDPVQLRLEDQRFWLSIADTDVLLWVRGVAFEGGFDVETCEPDVSPLAVQGPKARDVIISLFGEWITELKNFWFRETDLDGIPLVLQRSGWSKQGGYELYLRDSERGTELWNKVKAAGQPFGIGPGAPNYIERLESSLLSIGADTLWDSDPFEAGLDKMLDLDRDDDFIGKAALRALTKSGSRRKLVAVIFDGDPIEPNEHPWPIFIDGTHVGSVRSAGYSPRRKSNVGFALVDRAHRDEGNMFEVRNGQQSFSGEIVAFPIVEPGTPLPDNDWDMDPM
jgi:glycine cleavage system aminomethyltransferase T